MSGKLFFGDNLEILREHVKDATVDLVYLDPPFNSNASYNVFFRSPRREAEAQERAFDDTWRWDTSADAAMDGIRTRSLALFKLLIGLQEFLGKSDTMAYLAMMGVRLIELRRVLKPTGSLYLHCDPTSSHYLKLLLDAVFGPECFRNEIVWKRTNTHNDSKTWSRVADRILYYSLGGRWTWRAQHEAHDDAYLAKNYRFTDSAGRRYRLGDISSPSPRPNMTYEWRGFAPPIKGWRYSRETMSRLDHEGRIWYPTHDDGRVDTTRRPALKRYLDEMKGAAIGNVWTDIPPIGAQARERLGYPTQKPLKLLHRIIAASSNEGDVVLDPFCGCGTAIHAAHELRRNWIGIDIAYVAIKIICDRLDTHFPGLRYLVLGKPKDMGAARRLAQDDWHQFQNWAVACLGGQSNGKGSDGGIDGEITFLIRRNQYGRCIVSVKSGQRATPDAVRSLTGKVASTGADLGILVCLEAPSAGMRKEAASAGSIELFDARVPRIQIASAQQLIAGFNPGFSTVLNTVAAAHESRKAARRGQRKPTDKRQPQFLLPITGRADGQASAKRNAVLDLEQAEETPRRTRKRQV